MRSSVPRDLGGFRDGRDPAGRRQPHDKVLVRVPASPGSLSALLVCDANSCGMQVKPPTAEGRLRPGRIHLFGLAVRLTMIFRATARRQA
jgi:hypothetical protein